MSPELRDKLVEIATTNAESERFQACISTLATSAQLGVVLAFSHGVGEFAAAFNGFLLGVWATVAVREWRSMYNWRRHGESFASGEWP